MERVVTLLIRGGCLAAAAMLVSTASAQTYPLKPVRVMVGFSAGGGTDVTARVLAQKLSEYLGQPVIVENRPGSGGMIATEAVAKAAADGYTLLMVAAADVVQPAMRAKLATTSSAISRRSRTSS
jgi:tripartite-type tricarboxylate transporter receptor subunit TctC